MNLRTSILGTCAAIGLMAATGGAAMAQADSPLIFSRPGHIAHFFPTHQLAKDLGLIRPKHEVTPTPALTYHGGPVMQPALHLYIIYWNPGHLQSGASSIIPTGYKTVTTGLVHGYLGHDISAINTQYYQGTSPKLWITGTGGSVAPYNDTQAYPVSGCNASIGPNCFTDAQLETEVQRVMGVNGWVGGLDKMFIVFTSPGEGSCFTNATNQCSTETANVNPAFCAYHSYIPNATPIVYSNEPNGNPNSCLGSGTQPNLTLGGAGADPASTAASHEISEAITDPELNAWWDSATGQENGDLCAYNYISNTWDGGLANQYWAGRYFELQSEYNNHTSSCVLSGP
jgi:hypothetical protein